MLTDEQKEKIKRLYVEQNCSINFILKAVKLHKKGKEVSDYLKELGVLKKIGDNWRHR